MKNVEYYSEMVDKAEKKTDESLESTTKRKGRFDMIKVLKRTFEFILVFQIFGHLIAWSVFVIMFATQQPTYPLINVELLAVGWSMISALFICICFAPLIYEFS